MNTSDSSEEEWPPINIFYSYAHEDEEYRKKLEDHLSVLRHQGLITEWHAGKIVPGTRWADTINEHLASSQIILLLISPDFLASKYCYSVEMEHALKRHEDDGAYVVPVILRRCGWKRVKSLAKLQALPRNANPIKSWDDEDEAFHDVTEGIRSIVEDLRASPPLSKGRGRRPRMLVKDTNRQEMLRRVQGAVTQFLRQALGDTNAFIRLGLSERPEAVEKPWRLVYQDKNQLAQTLPPEAEIIKVYDEAKGELLILGEPGSGKTTLLYKLADDLLKRAFDDERHPIPVILHLSSWAFKRLPLAQWLVEELSIRYKALMKMSQTWIEHNRLILLLDGLDELDLSHRTACIQEINAYRQEHGQVSLVVCSRSAEYLRQAERIQLDNAVVIQPLTLSQIQTYLASAGESLSALRKALQNDKVSQELATTPLMLHLLMLTCRNASEQELATGSSLQEKRKQIFERYVKYVQEQQRGMQEPYTFDQTQKWLAWLAKQLTDHTRAELYLERIQPDWLAADGRWRDSRSRRLYRFLVWWGIILASGILSAIFYGPIGGTLFLLFSWKGGLAGLLGIGLLGGLIGAFANQIQQDKIAPAEEVSWSWSKFRHSLADAGLGAGCLAGLLATILLSYPLGGNWGSALLASVPLAVVFGLLYQAVNTSPQTLPGQGGITRRKSWLAQGMVDSFAVGLITFLLGELFEYWALGHVDWAFSFFPAILFGLLSLFVTLDPSRGRAQGASTRLSLRSKLRTGIGFGLAGALPVGLLAGVSISFVEAAVSGLPEGVKTGGSVGSFGAILCWWLFGIFFGLRNKQHREESFLHQVLLTWTEMWWLAMQSKALRYGVTFGLLNAVISGAVTFLFFQDFMQTATNIWVYGESGFVVGGVISIVLSGFSPQMREDETLNRPYQGIWYSWRNSVRFGLLFAVLGYSIELAFGGAAGLATSINLVGIGLIFATCSGVCGWLLNGGIACVQYVILRWLLWKAGLMPWAYVRFLDYATDRHLLYKVGGSYMFIHRFLQEYFASLEL